MPTTKETYTEPEETQGVPPTQDAPTEVRDILTDEPVIERNHTSMPSGGGEGVSRPMDEHKFNAPPLEAEIPNEQDEEEERIKPYENPSLKKSSPEEKRKGSEEAAKTGLDIFEGALQLIGNFIIPIKLSKLKKLEERGEIDLDVALPLSDGGAMSAGEAITDFNEKVINVFTLDQDYKDAALPIIASEFEKRNIGMTQLQYLGYISAKQLKRKIELGITLKMQGNNIIDALRSVKEAMDAGTYQSLFRQPPPQSQQTPQQETQQPAQSEYNTPPVTPAEPVHVSSHDTIAQQDMVHRGHAVNVDQAFINDQSAKTKRRRSYKTKNRRKPSGRVTKIRKQDMEIIP